MHVANLKNKEATICCTLVSSLLFSLAPTLQSSSSPFLSLQTQSVSRTQLIGVELHDEESSVAFSRSISIELDTCTEHK